tara:strand:+ start:453 stop:692 length:240 start_codon:yes stop_codon:yes gene_type:complete
MATYEGSQREIAELVLKKKMRGRKMFQRRHMIVIAELLKRQRMHYNGSDYMIMAFVDMLENDNPNFDREKFLKACGWED